MSNVNAVIIVDSNRFKEIECDNLENEKGEGILTNLISQLTQMKEKSNHALTELVNQYPENGYLKKNLKNLKKIIKNN